MGDLVKIQNERGLAKDLSSGAVVSVDSAGYKQYLARRESMVSNTTRIDQIESIVSNMQSDIADIKDSLKAIISIINKG